MINRCCWLDFSKGVAILLVIIGHALQYYLYPSTFSEEMSWRIVYSFHMPFFFILSGTAFSFSRKNGFSLFFIMSRLRRLMIPFVSWALVNMLIMTLINEKVSMLSYVINPAHGGLWYLWALFYISIFFCFITYVFTRIPYQLIASLLFYVALIVLSNTASGKFGLNEISRYFIFFVLGYYARSLGWINYLVSSKKQCFLLFSAAVIIWCVAFFAFVPNSENNFVNWIYKSSIALSGSTVALLLCILMTSIKIPFKFVEMFGANTLGMYAVNTYIIYGLSVVLCNPRYFIVALLLDIVLSYYASRIMSRFKISNVLLLGNI